MHFELTYSPEQERFRGSVRDWLAANVPQGLNRRPKSMGESYKLYLERRQFGRKLGRKGWLYPSASREYGGGGLDLDSVIILEEETHRINLNLPPYYDTGGLLGSATIGVWGTEEQKKRLLPPIYTGEVRTWQLLTEPNAGSDLAGVSLSARSEGDHYVLNGQKCWIGSAHGADRFWMIANTDPGGRRHHNLSWFMIDANLPGISTQPQYVLADHGEGGADEGHKNTIYFDNVRVPMDALIGGENNGWKVATTHLELEHGALGEIRRNLIWDRLLAYCKSETRNGKTLIEDSDVRDGLADIYVRLETTRLLGVRNFWLLYAGKPGTYEGPQHSYVRKTTGLWLTKAISDIIGPAAMTDDEIWGALDGHAEHQQREGIVSMHPGGTADIQRVIISRRLGLGHREPERAGSLAHTVEA